VLAAAAAFSAGMRTWAAVVGLAASRLLLAVRLDGARGWRLEWLLGEALLLVAWILAVGRGPRVTWRGRHYRLGAGGVMRPEPVDATERAPT
jgi:hypothetical protein